MAINDLKVTESDKEGKLVQELSDTPSADGVSAAELKERFDALGVLLTNRFNALIDALASTATSSGAEQIGTNNSLSGNNVATNLAYVATTLAALENALAGKQSTLTLDEAPSMNSVNFVNSGAVWQAIHDISISGGVQIDAAFNLESTNPLQNKVITAMIGEMNTVIDNKVDQETGKGLSTNDYTTAEKNKLAGVEHLLWTASISNLAWTQTTLDGTSVYIADITASGIKTTDTMHIGLDYDAYGDVSAYEQALSEWSKVNHAYVPASDTVRLVAMDKAPESLLNIVIEVMRA